MRRSVWHSAVAAATSATAPAMPPGDGAARHPILCVEDPESMTSNVGGNVASVHRLYGFLMPRRQICIASLCAGREVLTPIRHWL